MYQCINVIVKTSFEAIHNWSGCNIDEVIFLKNPHRHKFYVTIKSKVTSTDRELEFFDIKRKLDDFLKTYPYDIGSKSCEMICEDILNEFPFITYVSVFEDNENGSEIYR